jgi:hypothetical protein
MAATKDLIAFVTSILLFFQLFRVLCAYFQDLDVFLLPLEVLFVNQCESA